MHIYIYIITIIITFTSNHIATSMVVSTLTFRLENVAKFETRETARNNATCNSTTSQREKENTDNDEGNDKVKQINTSHKSYAVGVQSPWSNHYFVTPVLSIRSVLGSLAGN